MRELTKAEEMLLLTILRLKEKAYGVAIKRHIQKATGKSLPYGTLYFILDQLTKTKPERGGRSRIYYTLAPEGGRALRQAYKLQKKIWNGYAELTWGEKADK
jgi:DNA-binding PadR family transcriptional regulator